jgi:Protein of unknown function (DUF1194)
MTKQLNAWAHQRIATVDPDRKGPLHCCFPVPPVVPPLPLQSDQTVRDEHANDLSVIDVSSDGTSNSGRSVTAARDDAVGKGITINGLARLAVNSAGTYGRTPMM